MVRMTGGQAMVESLRKQRVTAAFGIISIHNLHMYDALYDVQDSLRVIGGRTELGCTFMADGYARATGRPGVAISSTGPGAANTMHAMGEAYHSASPVLQITTNVERPFINSLKMVIHEPKDQLEMFRSVTDWNALIPSVESIPDYVDKAFVRFKTRRPRPIELEIPTDLLAETADVEIGPPTEPQLPAGEGYEVEQVVQELLKAKRPVIIVGEEMLFTGGSQEVIMLAELLGVPVVNADGAKGIFPEDHPLSLGTILGNRIWGTNPLHEFLPTCDFALVLGSYLPHRSTTSVGLKLPAKLAHICLDPEAFGKNYSPTITIATNARVVAQQLLSHLEGKDVHKGDGFRKDIANVKRQIHDDLVRQWPNEVRALEAMRSALPRNTITCWDTAIPASRASRAFAMYEPNSYINPYGWVGIGFAFAASLGAKVGRPDRPVVCLTGDGGFQYCISELGTAAQFGINVTVVVFNDFAWGVLKGHQANHFNKRFIGTDLVNPDFVKMAEAYGLQGTRVKTVKELEKALGDAVRSAKSQLIEVSTPNGFGAFT